MALRDAFQKKDFVVTCELSPPKGNNPEKLIQRARELKNLEIIDAVNITDGQGANMRMSSLSSSYLVQREAGLETICQLVTRDRNKIALQADILGASALGIKNYLCLSGDKADAGDHPDAKEVFELSTDQLIEIFDSFTQAKDLSANNLDQAHNSKFDYFLAAAAHPGLENLKQQAQKMKKRLSKQISFFQTQIVYDLEQLDLFAKSLEKDNLKELTLIGLTPIKSLKMAEFLNEKVFGVTVPKSLITKIKESNYPEQQGLAYTRILIQEIKRLGFKGVHLMPIGFENRLSDIVKTLFDL